MNSWVICYLWYHFTLEQTNCDHVISAAHRKKWCAVWTNCCSKIARNVLFYFFNTLNGSVSVHICAEKACTAMLQNQLPHVCASFLISIAVPLIKFTMYHIPFSMYHQHIHCILHSCITYLIECTCTENHIVYPSINSVYAIHVCAPNVYSLCIISAMHVLAHNWHNTVNALINNVIFLLLYLIALFSFAYIVRLVYLFVANLPTVIILFCSVFLCIV